MEIGVYGGSFNPPHVGHAMVSSWLVWTRRVEEVWLLPTYEHPFDKQLASYATRVAMCEALAAELGDYVRICLVEKELPTPSYSIDTLRTLATRYPEHRFRLVVGADVLTQVDSWKAWDEIEAEFSPVVVGRHGYPMPPDAVEFPNVSSTEIRRRLTEGEPVAHLLPASVLAVIRSRGWEPGR